MTSAETIQKFLVTLAVSDEGFEMMLYRVKRSNPSLSDFEQRELLKKEIQLAKSDYIPSYLTPDPSYLTPDVCV